MFTWGRDLALEHHSHVALRGLPLRHHGGGQQRGEPPGGGVPHSAAEAAGQAPTLRRGRGEGGGVVVWMEAKSAASALWNQGKPWFVAIYVWETRLKPWETRFEITWKPWLKP